MVDTDPVLPELERAVAGRYSLERELGRGGMGAVFLARDLRLDRPVAIKVLPPALAVRPELRERFLRETRTAAAFSHPNIVSVHSVEETGSLLFFVMSYVEGETLAQRVIRQGPLPVPDATRLLQEVAWALSYAHARGVVHRDVKPDNILIERATGRALVMDFGIARSVAASGLTQMGETVGTPHFMSPEQAAGDTLDGRSDLYSLGAVAYFAVTGRLPFDADSAQAVMAAHISQTAVPVSRFRPDLPSPLAMAIDRCLAKAPTDRFPTGEALVEALEQVRARRIEVPPAIRVWTVRADQFFRNGILLAIFAPQVLRFGAPIAQLVFGAMVFAGVVPALWAQIPLGMRELARQGFGFGDLRSGILAIDSERQAVIAAMHADPRYPRRRRIRLLALFGGFALSIVTAIVAFAGRRQTGPNAYTVSAPALLALFLAVCLAMICLVVGMAMLSSSGRMDRRLHRLWTGRAGAALYRMASWRLAGLPTPTMTLPGGHGASMLFTSLDGALKRRLPSAKATLARLDNALADLERREQALQASAVEAKVGAPTLSGAVSSQQQALLDDLDRARRTVVDRRLALLGALENIRLSLVRLKSDLGTPETVDEELTKAARLLGGQGER
jgi:eukaryotic-like serine/threonine-protein kinase